MAEYHYLVSSLPMLMPDMEPVMNLEEFMDQCSDWLTVPQMARLEATGLVPASDFVFPAGSASALWNDWETNLRNRLAANRVAGSGQDAESILHEEIDVYGEIEQGIQEAWAQNDPLEREKILDRIRWRFLDDLENGHLFDFDVICIYKLKLLIREKWTPRTVQTGRTSLDETVTAIEQGDTRKEMVVAE